MRWSGRLKFTQRGGRRTYQDLNSEPIVKIKQDHTMKVHRAFSNTCYLYECFYCYYLFKRWETKTQFDTRQASGKTSNFQSEAYRKTLACKNVNSLEHPEILLT